MTPTADSQLGMSPIRQRSLTEGRLGLAAKAAAARALGTVRGICDRTSSTPDVSDEALIAAVAAGDRRAMHELFTRHQQRVYRFVRRIVTNRATAEDIVTDVFIELWRRAASFEGRARLSTWLLAIARTKALSTLRVRVDRPLDDAMEIADPADSAEESLHASERSAALQHCLAQLSPAHREIIDLVYYHEKSIDEVSAITGVPAATVKTRMFYARKRLAELMKAAGVETAGL